MTRTQDSTSSKQGVSLIEIIVYVALLGGISVFIANFLVQVVNSYHRARAEREVLSNARLVLETVNDSIAPAVNIYTPTSRFNDDAGQLSLVVPTESEATHQSLFTDFWVDNGRFFMRQEGGNSIPLSASSVRVAKFRLERIVQGLGREAIRVTLQIDYAIPKFAASATLNSTTALRGNY